MKITFHGAARTVTGSQHLIEVNGKTIMLDCGLFQGKRKEAFERNRSDLCSSESVDFLVLPMPTLITQGASRCWSRMASEVTFSAPRPPATCVPLCSWTAPLSRKMTWNSSIAGGRRKDSVFSSLSIEKPTWVRRWSNSSV